MKFIKLPVAHSYEIAFDMIADSTKYGERNYSWNFLRDRNIDVLFRYAYLYRPNFVSQLLIPREESNTYVFRCISGGFNIIIGGLKKILSSDKRNLIMRYRGASVEIIPLRPDSIMEILTREKADFAEDDTELVFCDFGQYTTVSAKSDGVFLKIYDRKQFIENGIKAEQLFTFSDNIKFKHTFRGLYMRKAPQAGVEYVTCVSGSAKVFALDMRSESDTYLKSFATILNQNESVFVERGYAVGIYSLEDDTIVMKKSDKSFDIKYSRRINIKSCPEAAELDLSKTIISALDRTAVMAEDFIEAT